MALYEIEVDGQRYELDIDEGQDVASTVDQFAADIRGQAPRVADTPDVFGVPDFPDAPATDSQPSNGLLGDVLDRAAVAGDFVRGTARDLTGADVNLADASLGEQAVRGVGLGVGNVVGAVPRTVAGLTDVASSLVNLPLAGADRVREAFGAEPTGVRLPVGAGRGVNDLLAEVFPEPANAGERVVQAAGDALLTGGAAGAVAASRIPAGAEALRRSDTIAGGLVDDIGLTFQRAPARVGAAEAGGGAGAAGAAELADQADLTPGQRFAAQIVGGMAGGVAPLAADRTLDAGRRAILDNVPGLAPERRAAIQLQSKVDDPAVAAQQALDAPEGVTPSRATGNTDLQAMESRVRTDDPSTDVAVLAQQAEAERTSLEELANTFNGVRQDPVDWQRTVVTRAAPEGAAITTSQPDEMLDEAFQQFRTRYAELEGYPVRMVNMRVEGGNVPFDESFSVAIQAPDVIISPAARESIEGYVRYTFDDMVKRRGSAEGLLNSQDLLEFRSTVRARQRQLQSAGRTDPTSAAQAELLGNVSNDITEMLESQLPEAASDALRALDTRYRDFKTVEDAVLRGTPGELRPRDLAQSVKMTSGSRSAVARGDSGALGQLAEQGMTGSDVLAGRTTPQAIRRATRNMTEEQTTALKGDVLEELMGQPRARGTDVEGGGDVVQGERLLREVERNRDRLMAAGFQDEDFGRIERAARELAMIQKRQPKEVAALLQDDVRTAFRLMAAVAGSRAGTRLLRVTGGASGAGPSLVLAQFGSQRMQQALTSLSVDKADEILRAAMTDRELFAALMTKPTDSLATQAQSAATIQAWLSQTAPDDEN